MCRVMASRRGFSAKFCPELSSSWGFFKDILQTGRNNRVKPTLAAVGERRWVLPQTSGCPENGVA